MPFSSTKLFAWLGSGLVLSGVALSVHAVVLLTDHVFDNVDLRTHYQWAFQFSTALAEGTWYPRWMSLANGGLGEPSFVIVHPGYYYFVSLVKATGLDLWDAMIWSAVASTFMIGVITIRLLYGRIGFRWALAGAVLLQSMSFASFLFGFHAALPWHFSLPLAVLVIGLSTVRCPRRIDLVLAASVAFLCITHLLVAFMVLLSISAMKALAALRSPLVELRTTLKPWIGSIALGLGLSAAYWVLAATSTPLFTTANRVDIQYLNWRNSFVFPFFTSGLFGTRWALVQWVLPIVPLSFLMVSAWSLSVCKQESGANRPAIKHLLVIGIFAFIMSSEFAYPLYATVGFLTNIQWPYRFLTVSNIAGVLAFTMAAPAVFQTRGELLLRCAIAACALMSMTLFIALQYKQYAEGTSPRFGAATMAGNIGQRGAEPATIGPEWRRYVSEGGLPGHCVRAQISCVTNLSQSHQRVWTVTSGAATSVVLPLFAFPAWAVTIDGAPIAPSIDTPTGLLKVSLLSGTHRVMIKWSLLWQERIGLTLSCLSALIWIILFIGRARRKKQSIVLWPIKI